ncbi:uncharacterized protein Dwil_GK20753 [Drosophila willistoni]|uniref:G-patch domain-containing protein n=1 Tax=Drosophila willistoni TaxID=7260 RepID=B4MJT1_DROWI|nr:G patch domain and ankyrin repeat-containing protein 1 homolog [Drosophila willistoni]EDW72370.1 uncharacterized protein Dwil_GK20753 [Drosophila willistoni]
MNSTGEELHPNWRALTTLHVPLKRFVPAGKEVSAEAKAKLERNTIKIDGAEAQKFYNEILDTPTTATSHHQQKTKEQRTHRSKTLFPYDKSKFFRSAINNNVKELSCIDFRDKETELNACDAYGWTALMMAACEGAIDAVSWLLENGVQTDIKDKGGQTALTLAQKKGHEIVVKLLTSNGRTEQHELEMTLEQLEQTILPFYCDVCERDYKETTLRAHQTSTVHQFNLKLPGATNKLNKFNISIRNRGLQLMVKQGWDREHGLGPTQSGRLYPVKTVLRKRRTGLGIEQSPPRVTHFQAFDTNATKRRNPHQPRRTRDDMRREKVREWKRERRLRNELS